MASSLEGHANCSLRVGQGKPVCVHYANVYHDDKLSHEIMAGHQTRHFRQVFSVREINSLWHDFVLCNFADRVHKQLYNAVKKRLNNKKKAYCCRSNSKP